MKHRMLTEQDRKEIRNNMMPGHFFGLLAGGASFIGMLLLFIPNEEFSIEYMLLSALVGIVAGMFVRYTMNKKSMDDLRSGNKKIVTAILQRKEARSIYGSDRGKGPAPALTNLINVMGEGVRKDEYTYYLIVDNVIYRTDAVTFGSVNDGDTIEMHYTMPGNWFLGFHKPE